MISNDSILLFRGLAFAVDFAAAAINYTATQITSEPLSSNSGHSSACLNLTNPISSTLSATNEQQNRFHCLNLTSVTLHLIETVVSPSERRYSNHGDPKLFCRSAKWTDILVFFLGNYVAHAAMILSLPGQSRLSSVITVITALLFPTSGVIQGFIAIWSWARLARSDLQMAARAGALCSIIKLSNPTSNTEGGEKAGEIVRSPARTDERVPEVAIELVYTSIHGCYKVPAGYALVTVPKHATFLDDDARHDTGTKTWKWWMPAATAHFRPADTSTIKIACNYNVVKILVASAQTAFGVITLYQTRGDQIKLYGYSAFGLTVVPYACMSLVNLLGNLFCPQYPAMYLVESGTLRDLRSHSPEAFQGIVC